MKKLLSIDWTQKQKHNSTLLVATVSSDQSVNTQAVAVSRALTPPALISFLLNSLVGLLKVSFSQRKWLTGGFPSKLRKRS